MRILAFAYSPGRGSEPGAGWHLARMLATLGDTVVVTSTFGRAAIEAALPSTPERARLHLVYVEIPRLLGRWTFSPRRLQRCNYLLWQFAALSRARALQSRQAFDLAWHLNIASVWFGSVAALVGPVSVYGVVGGGTRISLNLLPSLGLSGALFEGARSTWHPLKRWLNPLARLALRSAALILVQNQETLLRLPARHRVKVIVFSNVIVDDPCSAPLPNWVNRPVALYAVELRPFKGVCFAIRASSTCPEWQLLICGSGPDEHRLRRLAVRPGIERRVFFLNWLPRSEVLSLLQRQAQLFLFSTVHDEAGMAVAKALANGLAVVCADQGGPPALAGPVARAVPTRLGSRKLVEASASQVHATTTAEKVAA